MIGENIRKMRILKGMSLRAFGSLAGVSQTAVMKYENDELTPDGEKLVKFAKILECDVIDLLKDNSNRKPLNLNFRKREALKGKKLEQLKMIINDNVNNYLDVLELNNIGKKKLKKYSINSYDDAEKAASNFRKDNNINEIIPLADLCNIIENLGVYIVIVKNDNGRFTGFDGVSEIVEGFPFICIASDINYYRQRFTLAHELGHLVLDIKNELDEEQVCNDFASALLLPQIAMRLEFGSKRSGIGDREYEIVRQEYKVSIKAIIKRLAKCGIITSNNEKMSYIHFNRDMKDDEYQLSLRYKESSRQYEQLTLRLINQELITRSRFNELMKGYNVDE